MTSYREASLVFPKGIVLTCVTKIVKILLEKRTPTFGWNSMVHSPQSCCEGARFTLATVFKRNQH